MPYWTNHNLWAYSGNIYIFIYLICRSPGIVNKTPEPRKGRIYSFNLPFSVWLEFLFQYTSINFWLDSKIFLTTFLQTKQLNAS